MMDAVFFVYVISWRVLMLVILNVTAVSVYMGVSVRVLVGMNGLTVTVLVSVSVRVRVRMLQAHGVLYHDNRAQNHNSKRYIKLRRRLFSD